MTTEQKDYPTETRGDPAASVEEAKAAARAEGRRVRTVARIRTRGMNGQYIVTLALDVPEPDICLHDGIEDASDCPRAGSALHP